MKSFEISARPADRESGRVVLADLHLAQDVRLVARHAAGVDGESDPAVGTGFPVPAHRLEEAVPGRAVGRERRHLDREAGAGGRLRGERRDQDQRHEPDEWPGSVHQTALYQRPIFAFPHYAPLDAPRPPTSFGGGVTSRSSSPPSAATRRRRNRSSSPAALRSRPPLRSVTAAASDRSCSASTSSVVGRHHSTEPTRARRLGSSASTARFTQHQSSHNRARRSVGVAASARAGGVTTTISRSEVSRASRRSNAATASVESPADAAT